MSFLRTIFLVSAAACAATLGSFDTIGCGGADPLGTALGAAGAGTGEALAGGTVGTPLDARRGHLVSMNCKCVPAPFKNVYGTREIHFGEVTLPIDHIHLDPWTTAVNEADA